MIVTVQTKDVKIIGMIPFFKETYEEESFVECLPQGNIIKRIREASIEYDIK